MAVEWPIQEEDAPKDKGEWDVCLHERNALALYWEGEGRHEIAQLSLSYTIEEHLDLTQSQGQVGLALKRYREGKR